MNGIVLSTTLLLRAFVSVNRRMVFLESWIVVHHIVGLLSFILQLELFL